MNEEENISAAQERESEELCIQVNVNFNGSNDCTEIPADGEWYLTGYYDENAVFDNVEVYNRALSEDEIRMHSVVIFPYLEIMQIEFYQKKK